MASGTDAGRVTAVLGPTNTGKTHLAMERLLGHASGMIGFPLRLLARENYDRIVRIKGKDTVALVTGEERIVPPNPRWFVCTVEAMPLDRSVDFLAVDEIQLIGDPSRGHVFTERLLNARGRSETIFMGSDTARTILKRLVPEAEIIARPRFSTLSYTGPRKVTRLPPRSAVVAFSVADVFELAELVRRQRGGTAVVMGALSPRARNAQVALYQSGDVDYMVATDAIGMGLNMDLDHVALAQLTKFDGRGPRRLAAAEIAQIAGRAGRHMNDGTFGTTAEAGPLDPDLVEAIEAHRFDPLAMAWWRNNVLDFRSPALLLRSLDQPAPLNVLRHVQDADDHQALEVLGRQPDVTRRATTRPLVRLLWDVCQIPDFRKVMSEHHARLLARIYGHLTETTERLPADWVAKQLTSLERIDGDIDALVQRIAHIRTWTYITHRPGWFDDPIHWQERAIGIEDRLSDALHDRITQRFVDRRSAVLVRHLAASDQLLSAIADDGEVTVEGHFVGRIEGFRFAPDRGATSEATRMLLSAANRVLAHEVQRRARQLSLDADDRFALRNDGAISWRGAQVARLTKGETALCPRVDLFAADFLEGSLRDATRRRLEAFVRGEIARTLAVLVLDLAGFSPAARGLLFRLQESLGTLDAGSAASLLRALTTGDRRQLSRHGVRFGTETVYVDRLLEPAATALRALLWSVFRDRPRPTDTALLLSAPTPSMLGTDGLAEAIGYRIVGPAAIRVDRLEQFCARLRRQTRQAALAPSSELASLIGVDIAALPAVLKALGYCSQMLDGSIQLAPKKHHGRQSGRRDEASRPVVAADHPFAKLKELGLPR